MVFEGLQIKVIYDLYYGIFAAVITLIAILKIGLYFLDCFMYFFVSPFMILWQITIKEKTDRVNSYMVDGFIIYIIKPTLIVSSFFMFIISFEIRNDFSLFYYIKRRLYDIS